MAMTAACIGRRKIVPTLTGTMIMRRWETTRRVIVSGFVRRLAAAEKMKYFVPHIRRWAAAASPFSAGDLIKLSRSTGDYNYDLAVHKAIQHYHKHIKVAEEDGKNTLMYPLRGAKTCTSGVEMFHILLKTIGGKKYVSIYVNYVAPQINQLDDGALKLVFFGKLDKNVSLPFQKVVGEIRWPVSPLIVAAARFALAQHNTEEKLVHLIRANSQMVSEYEIFRTTFKAEFSGTYDAIVLVPRNNPEKMELVKFEVSNGWGMYGNLMSHRGSKILVPRYNRVVRYKYEDEYVDYGDGDDYPYEYENDEYVIDDPRVTAAARFALALHNKNDQVRRVVEATRRTYSGEEILSMRFDGELDGSRYYLAIVLVPVNDPENMRLAYFGLNAGESERGDPDEYLYVGKYGFHECSADDPRVMEVARLTLARHYIKNKRKDKLVRVVKATSRNCHRIGSRKVTYRVRLVGEDHPLRTYVATVSVQPHGTEVEHVCPEVYPNVKFPFFRPPGIVR